MKKILREKEGIVKTVMIVAISMAFVFGSAMATYVQAATQPDSSVWLTIWGEEGKEDDLWVQLKIHRYSLHKDFAIFHYILAIESGYYDDILVLNITVEAWSGPKDSPNSESASVMYGADTKTDIDIPALERENFRLNHKAYNHEGLFENENVWVYYFVEWTHGIDYYEKSGMVKIDAKQYWQDLGLAA